MSTLDEINEAWQVHGLPPTWVKLHKAQTEYDELRARVVALEAALSAAPQPAQPLDLSVMELAESVGLIGPASRTDDLHEAIQRFHDLIVVNASIKAALHFADGLAQPAQQPLTDEQIKRIMLDNGFTIKEGLTDLKPYVYAAARALIAAAAGGKND